ncbi:MAG TPA: GGDEF domain-containing protein, partial [Geminicoccaceae bacterium]
LARYRAELEARNREAERLLAEAAAARERAEAERRLLEHAAAVFPYGFAVADGEGRVVLANDAFGRALGLPGGHRLTGRALDGLAAAMLPAPELATWRESLALGDGQAVELALCGEVWLVLKARRSGDGRTVLSLVDVSGFKRNEAALSRLALEDHLTGLANRRRFAEAGRSALLHARRHARPLSLVIVDIDHFKRINDGFGHEAGDAVLRWLGALCRGTFRAGDTVGRIGGEEFAVLLPDTELAGAVALAERLREGVAARAVAYGDARIAFSLSAGVAELGPATRDADALLKAADQALYAAKRAGRDRVHVAVPPPCEPFPPHLEELPGTCLTLS